MMFLDLLPQEIDALWCFLDSEYLPGHHAYTLACTLMEHPDRACYDGDIETIIDLTLDKVKRQLILPLETGNVKLDEMGEFALREVLDNLYPTMPPPKPAAAREKQG